MRTAKVQVAFLFILATSMGACGGEPETGSMSSPDDFGRAWIQAWDSQDIEGILTFYTEDAFYEDVPSVENGRGGSSRGHAMIRNALAQMFEEMPDLGFEFVSAFAAGDRMVVEWIMTGTQYLDYTGRFSTRGVSVIRLEEDRIASISDYYDAYGLLSQLGVIPTLEAEQSQPGGDSVIQ